ncbi:MAG TPA: ribose 5-phosphate isomerase B [Candidatus Limihabitans stercoravium]|nr:ribose 5-phosphate isomerase B [Candidatus Limihabitans stercoravium]
MKISIGCDHGGFALKEQVAEHLKQLGHEVVDCGTYSTDSCDYPEFGAKAARMVADGQCQRGVVICTTGIGISISANKVKGIRCALCMNTDMAMMTRKHNDANMIAMGAKYVTPQLAFEMVDIFLATDFEGGRHQIRVDKLMNIER